MHPQLIERLDDFIVMVNSYPFLEREEMNGGIVRVYGKDGTKKKINYVIYPKPLYTKEYIEGNILEQYNECPLCKIGTEIIEKPRKIDEIKTLVSKKFTTKKDKTVLYTIMGLSLIPIGLFLSYFLKKDK